MSVREKEGNCCVNMVPKCSQLPIPESYEVSASYWSISRVTLMSTHDIHQVSVKTCFKEYQTVASFS